MAKKSKNPPPLIFDETRQQFDFQPFIAWLRDQGVFDNYPAGHYLGPTPENLELEKKVNAWHEPGDHYHLARFPGDEIYESGFRGSDAIHLDINGDPIELTAEQKSAVEKFRKRTFAGYADMVSKVMHPDVLKPWFRHSIEHLKLQVTHPGNVALEYDMHEAVDSFFQAQRNFVQALHDAISTSPLTTLTEEQKNHGQITTNDILKVSIEGGIEAIWGAMSDAQYAESNSHYRSHYRKETFKTGMTNAMKEGFFKETVRCPAEANTMRLSGVLGEEEGVPLKDTFGSTIYEFHQKGRALLKEHKQVSQSTLHADRIKESQEKCPYQGGGKS